MDDDLRYPIGKFVWPDSTPSEAREEWRKALRRTPAILRAAVLDLTAEQLATPYREGGWSLSQVVHHVADSHLQSYSRFKLALTEEDPLIKPYSESAWAELADGRENASGVSLTLLEALHERWDQMIGAMTDAEFERTFRHPEIGRVTLGANLALYAWHGAHHTAHIARLRARMGW